MMEESIGQKWRLLLILGNLQAGNPAPVVDLFDPEYPEGRIFLFYNTGDVSEHDMRLGKEHVKFILSLVLIKEKHGQNQTTLPIKFTLIQLQIKPKGIGEPMQLHQVMLCNLNSHPIKGVFMFLLIILKEIPLMDLMNTEHMAFIQMIMEKLFKVSPDLNTPSSNEAIGVELPDGRLMLNVREQNGAAKKRLIALSSTGGEQWDTEFFDSS